MTQKCQVLVQIALFLCGHKQKHPPEDPIGA
jgi:hypothetical protein